MASERNEVAESQARVRDTVIAAVFVGVALLPKVVGQVGPFAMLGPSATDMLWLPAVLYMAAVALRLASTYAAYLDNLTGASSAQVRSLLSVASERISPVLGLLTRLAFVVVIARTIADPTHSSLPQRLIGTVAVVALPAIGQLVSWLVLAVALVISLPVVAWFLASMVSGKQGDVVGQSAAQQTTKWLRSKTLRVAGYLLPVAVRACLRLMAAVGYLAVAALLWVAYGLRGLQLLSTNRGAARVRPTFGGQLLAFAGLLRGAVVSGASLGGLFARQLPGVHRDVIRVVRVQGIIKRNDDWRLPSNVPTQLSELNEFARAVIVAYDTALSSGAGRPRQSGHQPDSDDPFDEEMLAGRGRKAVPRYTDYTLTISRAWSTPAYHALVLRVSPPAAAEDAAKLPAARLIPLIDARSSWSARDLSEGLSLSDPRVRADEHREGQTGLFITLARDATEESDQAQATGPSVERDPVVDAIRSGLRQMGADPQLFRQVGEPKRSFSHLTYRFTTSHWTQTQAAGQIKARLEMIDQWKALRPAIRLLAGYDENDIALWHDDRERQFVLTLRVPPPPFPGDQPNDDRVLLRPFLQANGDAMRETDPRRFCVGLDAEGNPIWATFGVTPHALVAGTTGAGKSVSGVLGPMLQLAYANPPSDFGLWIVDTKHEAHIYLGDLPHTQHIFTPDGIEEVLPFLQKFEAEAKRRRLAYDGQDWHPGIGDPALVLVIEEWFQLIENAKSRDVGKAIEQVESTVKAIGAIARQVGCHIVLATQDPRKDTLPPSLADLLPLKLVTYGINEPMLRVIFGSQVDLEIAQVPKGKRGRLAVDGADGVDGVIQVQALWSHDTKTKPPADIKGLIDDIIRLWGRRDKPVQDERPEPGAYTSAFVDRTIDDEGDDLEDDEDSGERLERTRPANVASPEDDPALPPMPSASDFDASSDRMTFARAVLRLAYRYNAGHDTWQPITQTTVDQLIRDVPGRDSSVRRSRLVDALGLLADAGVLVPVPMSGNGERKLFILNWREAEDLLEDEFDSLRAA